MAERAPVSILLVDDDEPKRYTISRVLRKEGFEVREAASGAEALALAVESPDLIILDVHLPDLSGFDVCRRIKTNPATASIPVLHLSAVFVGSDDRAHGLDSGADGYLTQKVEPSELVATVRALLRARRAEDAARVAAHGWQVTFDAIRDGICLLDRRGLILRSNGAFGPVLGHADTDVSGKPLADFLPVGAVAGAAADMLAMFGREAVDLKVGERWLQVAADPIRNDRGEVDGAVCIIADVTDRRHMEDELRRRAGELVEAHRRKDEFLAMLAHELRNPLAPIRNAALLLAAGNLDGNLARETGGILERQVGHLSRLVDDLLDVSRIVRGKVELRREPVEIATVVKRAVEASRPLIVSQEHELSVSEPQEPVWVDGDPVRLAQVVSNLLNNAAKYMPPGGDIRLTVEHATGGVVIHVADEGIGISAELLPHVFDLFLQGDAGIERSQGGLGVGLTLVKNLVEMHDGSVSARSDGPGLGSEFSVRLPALPSQSRRAATPFVPSAVRRMRVLIVEDNVGAATLMGKLVERFWGHEVRVAYDGPTALAAVDEFRPEAVFCDIGLPGMSGYEVAKQMRRRPAARGALLVALTGYGAPEDRRQSAAAGFDEHLVKPAGVEALEALFRHPKLSVE